MRGHKFLKTEAGDEDGRRIAIEAAFCEKLGRFGWRERVHSVEGMEAVVVELGGDNITPRSSGVAEAKEELKTVAKSGDGGLALDIDDQCSHACAPSSFTKYTI